MKNFLILCLLLVNLPMYSQNKEIALKTDAQEVTVFINGAQVIRRKTVDIQQGTSMLKFSDLSPYIDPKSIQIKANGEVMVMSVNHQFNYIDSTLKRSKELEELNGRLKQIESKLTLENVNIEIINDEINFLKDNRVIGGKNQEVSLNNLKETSNYYAGRISTLKLKIVELDDNIEKLTIEKGKVEKQIHQLSTYKSSTFSEILVKINASSQTRCDLELSYFVKNAGWFPSYDIRSNSIDEPIQIVYKANIHQNTREDWKNVKLKLSSSDPNLGSVAPQLTPYFLNYNSLPPSYYNLNNQVSGRVFDASTNEPLPGVNIVIKGTTVGTITNVEGRYSISVPNSNCELEASFVGFQKQNLAANNPTLNFLLQPDVQSLEEVVVVGYGTAKKSDLTPALSGRAPGISIRGSRSIKDESTSLAIPIEKTENKTAFEFDIKTPYSLTSDNKNLTVDIEKYLLDANYEYYCVPKIDKDAFLIANIVNWEKYNFLEGEANIFFENTFIGKSILDVRYVSDTLQLSLGRDKNVVVKREKLKDFTKKQFLGSKKEETRAWAITIKNNKKQPIVINMYDQVPISTMSEIEVQAEDISGGNLKSETGEVNWIIKLEPSAKKELQLKYKVKYPKERILMIE